MRTLMVIISDRLSNLVEKGEVTENYYNPGNMFDDVHIVMTNNDAVDAMDIQKTAGTARLTIHNIPTPSYHLIRTMGWRPALLNKWARGGIELARKIKPDIIRCYGNRLSGYLSYCIKRDLNIPYVLSMHENPDNIVKSEKSFPRRVQYALLESMGKRSLLNAEMVIAVYDSTISYLKRMGVKRYTVIYNAVNGKHIKVKESYQSEGKFKIISTGRLISIKNPVNLIKAVCHLDRVKLTIVGDGPEYASLKGLADKLNSGDKVEFIKRMDNDVLCQSLRDFDVFAIQCNGTGVPKTVIEAWLAGMPVITNRPESGDTKEYIDGQNIALVEDTVEGYRNALVEYMGNESLREKLGRKAREIALLHYEPQKNEQKVVDILDKIISTK